VNRVDGVILGVGVVVLLASVLGVIFYDDTAGETYAVSWEEGDETTLDEFTDTGAPDTFEFEAPIEGTLVARTAWEVGVSASGNQLSDDSVTVTATGPQDQEGDCGFTIAATDGSGSCTAEVDVNEQPDSFEVTASNRTEAESRALEQRASTNGTGLWNVTVEIDGGQEVSDPDYEVTLTPTVVEWRPTAERPPGPGSGPG
jgi:hypothetical protein